MEIQTHSPGPSRASAVSTSTSTSLNDLESFILVVRLFPVNGKADDSPEGNHFPIFVSSRFLNGSFGAEVSRQMFSLILLFSHTEGHPRVPRLGSAIAVDKSR